MSIFDKLAKLFKDTPLPDETKDIFVNTSDTKELLSGLDKLITRNELRLKQLNKELENLEEMEQADVKKIKEAAVRGRSKNNVLRSIKRMRRQLDNLERRIEIYDRNINLHLNLIGKIQQMEAMSLAGVDEEQIDDIILDFESHFEEYTETVAAGETVVEHEAMKSTSDEELADLEAEIKGEKEPEAKTPEEKDLRKLARSMEEEELRDLEKEIVEGKPREKKKKAQAEEEG
jgi:hypothetical protein